MAATKEESHDLDQELDFETMDPDIEPGPGMYKVINPIIYKGRRIDDKLIASGIEVELDADQAEWLRREGCIE